MIVRPCGESDSGRAPSYLLLFTDAVAFDVMLSHFPASASNSMRATPFRRSDERQAKVRPLVILNRNILKLRRHGFSLFAGEGVIRNGPAL